MNDTNDELQERVKLLEIGHKYSSRMELLNILNLPVIKNGKGRIDQDKKLKRYIKYERIGHTYIVTEIFDDPIARIRAAKYVNFAIVLLFRELLLLNNETYANFGKVRISDYCLFIILCFCNESIFGNESNRLKEIHRKYPGAIETEEQVEAYRSFFYKNMEVVREQVRRIRKTLTSRKYLYWNRIFYVNTYGQAPDEDPREATDNEIACITEAQRLALKEMGLESEFQVMRCWQWVKDSEGKRSLKITNRWQEYYEKTLANLQRMQVIVDENERIKDFEEGNKIIFHRAGVEAGLALYSENCGLKLNNLMLDKLIATYNTLLSWDATFKNEVKNCNGMGAFDCRQAKDRFNSDHSAIAELAIEQHHTQTGSDKKIQLDVIRTCPEVPYTGFRRPKYSDFQSPTDKRKLELS